MRLQSVFEMMVEASTISKEAGLKDIGKMIRSLGRRMTKNPNNIEKLMPYADDVLFTGEKMSNKVRLSKMDDVLEEAVEVFNRGEIDLSTINNLVRERDILNKEVLRSGQSKLLDAINTLYRDNPLKTTVGSGLAAGLLGYNFRANKNGDVK